MTVHESISDHFGGHIGFWKKCRPVSSKQLQSSIKVQLIYGWVYDMPSIPSKSCIVN